MNGIQPVKTTASSNPTPSAPTGGFTRASASSSSATPITTPSSETTSNFQAATSANFIASLFPSPSSGNEVTPANAPKRVKRIVVMPPPIFNSVKKAIAPPPAPSGPKGQPARAAANRAQKSAAAANNSSQAANSSAQAAHSSSEQAQAAESQTQTLLNQIHSYEKSIEDLNWQNTLICITVGVMTLLSPALGALGAWMYTRCSSSGKNNGTKKKEGEDKSNNKQNQKARLETSDSTQGLLADSSSSSLTERTFLTARTPDTASRADLTETNGGDNPSLRSTSYNSVFSSKRSSLASLSSFESSQSSNHEQEECRPSFGSSQRGQTSPSFGPNQRGQKSPSFGPNQRSQMSPSFGHNPEEGRDHRHGPRQEARGCYSNAPRPDPRPEERGYYSNGPGPEDGRYYRDGPRPGPEEGRYYRHGPNQRGNMRPNFGHNGDLGNGSG